MDSTEQKNHTCAPGHCCSCEGCGSMCMRNKKNHYWLKHMIVLSLGVIAAFYVGMKLGEMKGYIMSSYNMTPMHNQRWMMDGAVRTGTPTVQQVQQ